MRSFVLLTVAFFWTSAQSQEQEVPDTVFGKSETLEEVLEEITQDATDSQLADILAQLEERPLDLNMSTESELQQIPGITPMLALRIVLFRERKWFTSVNELLGVEGMTNDLFARIRKYLTVIRLTEEDAPAVFGLWARSRIQSDLQERAGFRSGAYAGSPIKSYNKIVAHYSEGGPIVKRSQHRVEFGLLTEKDPGERALNDFVAGYFMANLPSIRGRVILGDFVVEAGEGLVLWRSVGFSKGSEVISPLQKRGSGIKPYLSTDENLFFRGVAMEWRVEDFSLTVFHSNKPITASINTVGNITSVFSDGYHRTSGELAKKNNSRERLSGFRVDLMPIGRVKVGATAYQAQFAHGLFLNEASGYQGAQVSAGGLDFSYTDNRVSFFSEAAKTKSSPLAAVAGLVFEPDKRVDLALTARYYPKEFANIHAFGFREGGSLTENESGIYIGAKFLVSRSFRLSAYYDQFRFPWRSSLLELPASGNDFLLMSDISISRNIDLQMLYKNRHKSISLSETDSYGRIKDAIGERNQRNYRATLRLISSAVAEWKSRFEMVDVFYPASTRNERGYLWMQDARLRPGRSSTVDTRVIIFQTDSFDSRVYEFESDVRGTFSNPALFGKGIRWYIVTRHRLSGNFEASAKYSRTIKDGVKTLSSGLSEIIGDADGQLSFQIDVVF